MWFIYFALLLGGLIFFHELGHFLAAKMVGVRVLRFSIGFGPTIPFLSFTKGETEYTIKLLPLGGYVRFYGDDPTEELSPEDRRGSFNYASLPRRYAIVLAGPLFNLVLPFLIFFPMFTAETEAEPAVIGHVVAGGPAATGGLVAGDEVLRIGDDDVRNFWELQRIVSRSAGEPLAFTVRRDGETLPPMTVTPEEVVARKVKLLDWEERRGRIQVTHQAIAPVIAVRPGTAAERAGLRTFDRIVRVNGEDFSAGSWDHVMRTIRALPGPSVRLIVHRGPSVSERMHAGLPLGDLFAPIVIDVPTGPGTTVDGMISADVVVAVVKPNTPAQRELSLLVGDRILALDGKPVTTWVGLADKLEAAPEVRHELTVERGALARWVGLQDASSTSAGALAAAVTGEGAWTGVQAAAAQPESTRPFRIEQRDGGQTLLFGAYNRVDYVTSPVIDREGLLYYAAVRSWEETVHAFEMTILTVAGLFRGRVPMDEIGGPMLIADLASKTQERGWGYFFWLMVVLSVNLGILNLLPIPILDGGHLLFFTLEAIRRRPLSLRARQYASYFGLACIVLLMGVAFRNDLARYWGTITGAFGCDAGF